MTEKKKTEIAVVEEKNEVVAQSAAPAFKVETSATDMILPFLKVIQSQADEVTRGKDKYNEKVKAGDIYDSVTRTIYDNPEIIICGIKKYYGEWEGDVRGRLIAKHKINSDAIKNAKKIDKLSARGIAYTELQSQAGNRLEETFGVVCLVDQGGVSLPATFTLSKTAFAAGKTLNTLLTMYQTQGVPKFKFGTNIKQNDKGSWFVPVFEFAGFEEDPAKIAMAAQISHAVEDIIFAFSADEKAIDAAPAENEDIV